MSGVNPVAVSANPFQFGAGSIQKLIEKDKGEQRESGLNLHGSSQQGDSLTLVG